MRSPRPAQGRDRLRGQALVEFAIALPVFLLLLLGVFSLGLGVYTWNGLSEAAREIARTTSVHPGIVLGASTDSRKTVNTQLGLVPGMVDPPPANYKCVDISGATTGHSPCLSGDFVQVTVTANFRPVLLLGLGGPITLASTSTIQIPIERILMKGFAHRSRRGEDGQILVLFALSAVAIMAAVGLVLDGGGAFAQRRAEQNGADLASMAGANAYMNTAGLPATRTAAAISAARAVATRNGYTHGVNGATVNVVVSLLASGANVQVDVGKPHINSFSSIIPGQGQWNVSTTATSLAGTIDTTVGAAPWTMSIDA